MTKIRQKCEHGSVALKTRTNETQARNNQINQIISEFCPQKWIPITVNSRGYPLAPFLRKTLNLKFYPDVWPKWHLLHTTASKTKSYWCAFMPTDLIHWVPSLGSEPSAPNAPNTLDVTTLFIFKPFLEKEKRSGWGQGEYSRLGNPCTRALKTQIKLAIIQL